MALSSIFNVKVNYKYYSHLPNKKKDLTVLFSKTICFVWGFLPRQNPTSNNDTVKILQDKEEKIVNL